VRDWRACGKHDELRLHCKRLDGPSPSDLWPLRAHCSQAAIGGILDGGRSLAGIVPAAGAPAHQGNGSLMAAGATQGRQRPLLWAACLFAVTVAVYSVVARHEFVNFDDLNLVVGNPNLMRDATPMALLSHFWQPVMGNWLPLYWISMHLGYALHGPDAGAFLLTNVVLHALSSAVLLLALTRMTGALGCSAFVAGVFALHPLHVESVAWVTERKDVMSGLFWMAGLYAYAWYVERPSSRARYLTLLLCFGLGLLSKSTGVSFPFVLLLLDFWPLERLRGALREAIDEKVPLVAMAIVASAVTFMTHTWAGNTSLGVEMGLEARLANAMQSYWLYLGDAFWPTGLAAMYPHPFALAPPTGSDRRIALGLGLALLLGTLAILRASRRRGYLAVGWLWFLGTLVPMIGIIHVGLMGRADRYMYVPLVGLSIAVAFSAGELAARSNSARRLVAVAGVAALVAMGAATRVQLGYWKDTYSLFQRAVDVVDDSRFAHEKLGFMLAGDSRYPEAAEHFELALQIEPGRMRVRDGLAISFLGMGDVGAAIEVYREDLWRYPERERTRGALGTLLVQAGRYEEAEPHLERALALFPEDASYHEAMGEVARMSGRPAEAIDHYRAALARKPGLPKALRRIAWLLATSTDASLRDPQTAIRIARDGLQRLGEDAELIDALAAAHASEGRYADAARLAERALALAMESGNAVLSDAIRGRLDVDRKGQPVAKPNPQG
jgi:tetratricopeptide (TPR) repeat protein